MLTLVHDKEPTGERHPRRFSKWSHNLTPFRFDKAKYLGQVQGQKALCSQWEIQCCSGNKYTVCYDIAHEFDLYDIAVIYQKITVIETNKDAIIKAHTNIDRLPVTKGQL